MKDEIKGVIYVCLIIILVVLLFNFLNSKVNLSNKMVLKYLNNNFDYVNIENEADNDDIMNKFDILNFVNKSHINISFLNGDKLLEEYYSNAQESSTITEKTIKQDTNISNVSNSSKPIVYIYNTHNKEQYSYDKNAPYNIVPTVLNTSYMLKEFLSKNNIESIVEESDISLILKQKKWNYASSYKASRILMEEAVKKNNSLTFFIDVHRDSVSYKTTTIEIDGVKYARVLFILGLENKDYLKNLKMIEYINNKLDKEYKGITRGILKKQGTGVNGIYNQDFSENCILIEFGGKDNTIDEVYNTTKVVAKIISDYIGDYNENR